MFSVTRAVFLVDTEANPAEVVRSCMDGIFSYQVPKACSKDSDLARGDRNEDFESAKFRVCTVETAVGRHVHGHCCQD